MRGEESRRIKYLTLLALVLGGGVVLLSATQTWFIVQVTATVSPEGTVTVVGAEAGPELMALSLASFALTAALAIAGSGFRVLLSLLGIVLGASIVFSVAVALVDPVGAASGAITSATGVAGEASQRALVESSMMELWPWLAVVGGVMIVVAAAATIVFVRAWPGPSHRYQTRSAQARFVGEDGRGAAEVIAEWKVNGEGGEGAADSVPGGERQPRAAAEPTVSGESNALDRDAAIDSWDDLSRGDDPTR